MALVVQKYGGTSLANAERIKNVARRIAATKDKGNQVVVVASAMGDTTDELIQLAQQITATPSDREMDMLLATGDLVDRGDGDSYRRLRNALDGCPFPVLYCLGNHDVRENFIKWFPETPTADGFVQYEHETPDLRILFLDTLEEGRHGGAFCETRANWLKARLAEKPDTRTLIIMHHHPVEVGESIDAGPDELTRLTGFHHLKSGRRPVHGFAPGVTVVLEGGQEILD